jgi:hypothetical protein
MIIIQLGNISLKKNFEKNKIKSKSTKEIEKKEIESH